MTEANKPANLGAMPVPGTESMAGVEAPQRGPVFGSRFAVASDHSLASLVAMNVMQSGGNAADATVAASAVNVVTKPHRTHLGGDAFALVWRRQHNTVDCLNAGGLAPKGATSDRFADGIPNQGAASSTVPGLVDAWVELNITYGTTPLDKLLEPAIRLAEEGFPVSQRLSGAMTMLSDLHDPAGSVLRSVFLKNGRTAYAAGETLRQPDLAGTLRRIADEGREGLYEGEVAGLIAKAIKDQGGLIDETDLAEQTAHWHDPLVTSYRDCQIYEQALPSQGIILLEALNIVEQFPLSEWGLGSANAVHVLAEAAKLAFADSRRYAADPAVESVPVEELLSKDFARKRAKEIDLNQAKEPGPAAIKTDTTEFVVGDEDLAIAFIQSIYAPWGSGLMIPGTGILMNNRLRGFSSDPASPNQVQPGKRTIHTLNTFMAIRNDQLVVGGGTPGGDFQVQTNLQTLIGALDWQLDLQAAVDAPRWAMLDQGNLTMESRFTPTVRDELGTRGHNVQVAAAWDGNLARSQVIASRTEGGWAVASDLRGEGVAMGI